MKQHTAQFKSELKQMGKQIDCIVTYGTTTLHDELMTIIPLMFCLRINRGMTIKRLKEIKLASGFCLKLTPPVKCQGDTLALLCCLKWLSTKSDQE